MGAYGYDICLIMSGLYNNIVQIYNIYEKEKIIMDPSQVRVHSDEKLSPKASLFYGFQSLLACNLFLGPLVVIGVLQYDVAMAAAFIGMTFFACGIATIVQSGFFLKMQVIQGMSFACFGAIFAIVMGADFPTLIGALLVSSLFIILLGATGYSVNL